MPNVHFKWTLWVQTGLIQQTHERIIPWIVLSHTDQWVINISIILQKLERNWWKQNTEL